MSNNLFSEVYGCYYKITAEVLNSAKDGITKQDAENIINKNGFSETVFHLAPELLGNNWKLLDKKGDLYYSNLDSSTKRPLTNLELSWLSAIILDPRIELFIDKTHLEMIRLQLKNISPLFKPEDFFSPDRHLDSDPYHDIEYIENFRKILFACKNKCPVKIFYCSEKSGLSQAIYYPYKLSYSGYNDKFRLLCTRYSVKRKKLKKFTLNLARIKSAEIITDYSFKPDSTELSRLFCEEHTNPPLVIEISKERNALERFLMQFASFDRMTEYDSVKDLYFCRLSYDKADETELLIRILSFGPAVRVLEPASFVAQIKKRVSAQLQLLK